MTARMTSLGNGMRVATDDMAGLHSAAVAVRIGAGARHEAPSQNGMAHFLEHMAFKGTATRSALRIAESIEDVGGSLNAYTGRESTAYLATVLGEDVPLAIDLIADIVRRSIFDPGELELERSVILNEIGECEDSPTDMVFEALQRTAYPDQPYGRPVIGTPETVSGFSREDVLEFVSEHYIPERMILTAAGAVDHDRVVALAQSLFGDMEKRPARAPQPARFADGEHRREKQIEQAQFALAFEGPPLLGERDAACRMYSIAMGGGASSRLFAEAREKRGLCYAIGAFPSQSMDTGALIVHAGTGEAELEELARLCIDEIRRSADTLTEGEVRRARTQIRVALLMGQESPMNRIERMGAYIARLGKIEDIEDTIARYDGVTLGRVAEFAASLADARMAVAAYGPVSGAPRLDALKARMAS